MDKLVYKERTGTKFNLTNNKAYEVEEAGSFFIVTNDKGLKVRYNKNFFEHCENYHIFQDEDGNYFIHSTINGEVDTFIISTSELTNSYVSCGLWEFNGLNTIMSYCSHFKIQRLNVFKDILTCILEKSEGHLLLSTNYIEDFTPFYDVLNSLSLIHQKDWIVNPNSGNRIYFWILEKTDDNDFSYEEDEEDNEYDLITNP